MGSQWSQVFPPKSKFTEADVQSQDGKVFLITGAKAEQAIKDIRTAVSAPTTGSLHFLHLELDDLSSIKATVETFKAKESKPHVLWNNESVSRPPIDSVSKQGIELQLATNCLGPFLLTKLLLPLLQAASGEESAVPGSVRVVWTASQVIELSSPDGGLIMSKIRNPPRDSSRVYTNSKTGNWFLASELGRRMESVHGIVSVALNPGAASSNLFRHTPSVNYLV
ncbi:hypothetical protein F4818DRAFT_443552 [Hypoxylon cercidicola]|nr:hypothetical protein F4818DRAFT_443552 [Hypoxylon cercidicola]